MGCALLVANENVVNLWVSAKRIVSWKDCAARVSKDVLHSLSDQALPQDLRTGLHRSFISSA
jgi:hypothetical protein